MKKIPAKYFVYWYLGTMVLMFAAAGAVMVFK